MELIVIGEEGGRIKLVSKSNARAMLPKGSYLTITSKDENSKFILRVDDTKQHEPYQPDPLIVDMDLSPLAPDQYCQNVVFAYRVKDISTRTDGLIDFIPPQAIARRSSQEEINLALGNEQNGPPIFLATLHASQNQILRDEKGNPITANLPEDMFFHQVMICGKTGSGKTVATKYLAQYFVEQMEGAVLAINVKDVDFLRMNKPSVTKNQSILEEWNKLNIEPSGIENYVVYYPANNHIDVAKGVDPSVCKRITLDVKQIEPESLTGLLQGLSDTAAQSLPSIFRWWQNSARDNKDQSLFTFSNFVNHFQKVVNEEKCVFPTLNIRGEQSTLGLHRATCDLILRKLNVAIEFFDNPDSACLSEKDILQRGKMSVINVAGNNGIQFGSILLRDLLHRIVEAKSMGTSKIKILIIIDEVHQFYNTSSSREALGELDTICRTGRSQGIGVIFSSQNPSDMPSGLSSVINTKIFFKTDTGAAKNLGIKVSDEEMESLKKGYAVASVHELSQVKVVKFPMAVSGVFEEEKK
jgi:Cdc6-like AAA superfamily ATPase